MRAARSSRIRPVPLQHPVADLEGSGTTSPFGRGDKSKSTTMRSKCALLNHACAALPESASSTSNPNCLRLAWREVATTGSLSIRRIEFIVPDLWVPVIPAALSIQIARDIDGLDIAYDKFIVKDNSMMAEWQQTYASYSESG